MEDKNRNFLPPLYSYGGAPSATNPTNSVGLGFYGNQPGYYPAQPSPLGEMPRQVTIPFGVNSVYPVTGVPIFPIIPNPIIPVQISPDLQLLSYPMTFQRRVIFPTQSAILQSNVSQRQLLFEFQYSQAALQDRLTAQELEDRLGQASDIVRKYIISPFPLLIASICVFMLGVSLLFINMLGCDYYDSYDDEENSKEHVPSVICKIPIPAIMPVIFFLIFIGWAVYLTRSHRKARERAQELQNLVNSWNNNLDIGKRIQWKVRPSNLPYPYDLNTGNNRAGWHFINLDLEIRQ